MTDPQFTPRQIAEALVAAMIRVAPDGREAAIERLVNLEQQIFERQSEARRSLLASQVRERKELFRTAAGTVCCDLYSRSKPLCKICSRQFEIDQSSKREFQRSLESHRQFRLRQQQERREDNNHSKGDPT